MKSVVAWAIVLGGVILAGCGGSAPPVGKTCMVNSECANPLSCTFGKCHTTCIESRDCPNGQLCVKGPTGAVCQMPEESLCQYRSQCAKPLLCAIDRKCRSQCLTNIDCPTTTQKCILPDGVCAEPEELNPATMKIKAGEGMSPVPEIPDGGIPGADGAAGSGGPIDANMTGTGGAGGAGGGAGGSTGTGGGPGCTSPQTTFGNVVKGDGNASFSSGVGVRAGGQLLVFSGYDGPRGGAGQSTGPAAPLFEVPDAPYFYVQGAAVAPTGEIVVLHSNGKPGNGTQVDLFAEFLAPASGADAGAGGLKVAGKVQLEAVMFDTPRIIWSPQAGRFIASWQYRTTEWHVRVRKFLPDSRGGGGDTNIVPAPSLDNRWGQGNVATSGKFLGVATVANNTYYPYLTVLDSEGNGVGTSILLHATGLGSGPYWVTVGGTNAGFVSIAHQGHTAYQTFVPIDMTGAPSAPTDAGVPDGGISYAVTTFDSDAVLGHMVSDDLGGTGAVLLEPNGASFLYVKPDGVGRQATGTVISSAEGGQANISTYRGSFVVSLFEKTTHVTKVVASGCSP
jgi:hypothetical protein